MFPHLRRIRFINLIIRREIIMRNVKNKKKINKNGKSTSITLTDIIIFITFSNEIIQLLDNVQKIITL